MTRDSEVEVKLNLRPGDFAGGSWEQVRQALRSCPSDIVRRSTVYVSTRCTYSVLPELAAYALSSFPTDVRFSSAYSIFRKRIHGDFKYLPGSTKVGTPSLEVLQNRRGVCQDFAHLQIGCLRSLGLAARYVSGYLVTTPPAGQAAADRRGCLARVGERVRRRISAGWISIPTNGMMPLDSHITVAWGRDYDDVGPIRGILIGGHRQKLDVSVDVVPLESGF